MVDQGAGRLLIADENTYTAMLGTQKAVIQSQFQFSALLQTLDQVLRSDSAEAVQAVMQETFFNAPTSPVLNSEQLLLLFALLMDARRDVFTELSEQEFTQDTACFALFNHYLHSNFISQKEILQEFTTLCADTCLQREKNETHSTQAIIRRINRYIDDNIESYDLSLATLARISGFNPSYLSRFYRLNTGIKISDQIEKAKLNHAKKLIAQGELVKKVAERTGFASPSAFILFFKRNTGITPKQYFEDLGKKK